MTDTIAPSQPRVTRLSDYRPPTWLARSVQLFIDLHEDHARVRCRTRYERAALAASGASHGVHGSGEGRDSDELRLDGTSSEVDLVSLRLDGRELPPDEFSRDDDELVLWPDRDRFELEVVTVIRPHLNTALSGLYRSGSIFCTQMEAQGFRRVTYFQDRPDVLATWTVTLEADRARYPVLLSNGNEILTATGGAAAVAAAPGAGARGATTGPATAGPASSFTDLPPLAAGRHRATWHDPFPKPSYLFAVVAGDLGLVEDKFTTCSGRTIPLRIWCDKGNEGRVIWAMASLKHAMAWDERAFGREYDLDLFMIVAVNDFNMGAMENKGLNIFNASRVLADAATATDEDFQRVEGVVAHEYFHNWSGNRVTCRDWFQLSLKEGFTVYRDQEFTSDLNARAVKRIEDVRRLRKEQFPEDAGPMAHPVRPSSYIAIDNFYTRTVYEKGAEVIRMQAALLGPELFRKGCDLYFARHDGQAVTTDDFVAAMEEVSGRDLTQFKRWYEQAGTPVLRATGRWDAGARRYELELSQSCPATPGQPRKLPFHMPVSVALFARDGALIPGTERVLELREERQVFVYQDLPAGTGSAGPVPSVLRAFSAPVKLELSLSDEELCFLVTHDTDLFNRWESLQRLATRVLLAAAAARAGVRAGAGGAPTLPASFALLLRAYESVLDQAARSGASALDPAIGAELLRLPDESVLCDEQAVIDIDAIHAARGAVRDALASGCRSRWEATFRRLDSGEPFAPDAAAIGRRTLRNVALAYLYFADAASGVPVCVRQLQSADNLQDQLCALELLASHDGPERERALADTRARWQHEPLVMNKWFAAQAGADRPGVLRDVRALQRDPLFDAGNPNKLRALFHTFTGNLPHFHAADGSGYALYGDLLADLDARNPVLAGRFTTAFNAWKRHAEPRRSLQRKQLERLAALPGLSRNTYEVVSKALA